MSEQINMFEKESDLPLARIIARTTKAQFAVIQNGEL